MGGLARNPQRGTWGGLVPHQLPSPCWVPSGSGTPWEAPSPPAQGSLAPQRKGKGSGRGQWQPQGWGPGIKNRPGSGIPSLEGHPRLKLRYPQGLCSLWAAPPWGGEQCCAQGGALAWGLSACSPPSLGFLFCEMGPPAPAQDGCGAPCVEAASTRVLGRIPDDLACHSGKRPLALALGVASATGLLPHTQPAAPLTRANLSVPLLWRSLHATHSHHENSQP